MPRNTHYVRCEFTKIYKPRLVGGEPYSGGQGGVTPLPRAGCNAPPAELSIPRKWDANLLEETQGKIEKLFVSVSEGRDYTRWRDDDRGIGSTLHFYRKPHFSPSVYERNQWKEFFDAKNEEIHFMGFYHKLRLNCGFLPIAYINWHSVENLSLGVRKEVLASLKAASIHKIR